eukprot:COSAG05_NODE_951_length_6466_cov_130.129417_2_plen_233_part_00
MCAYGCTQCLQPGEWLNEEVINAYLGALPALTSEGPENDYSLPEAGGQQHSSGPGGGGDPDSSSSSSSEDDSDDDDDDDSSDGDSDDGSSSSSSSDGDSSDDGEEGEEGEAKETGAGSPPSHAAAPPVMAGREGWRRARIHTPLSYFYARLTSDKHGTYDPQLKQHYDYAGVQRWLRKVDLFAPNGPDALVIPLHCDGNHWCMMVIDFCTRRFLFRECCPSPYVFNVVQFGH